MTSIPLNWRRGQKRLVATNDALSLENIEQEVWRQVRKADRLTIRGTQYENLANLQKACTNLLKYKNAFVVSSEFGTGSLFSCTIEEGKKAAQDVPRLVLATYWRHPRLRLIVIPTEVPAMALYLRDLAKQLGAPKFSVGNASLQALQNGFFAGATTWEELVAAQI